MNIERRIATEGDLETLFEINERAMRAHIIENFGEWNNEEQRENFVKSTDLAAHELLLDGTRPFGFVNVFRSEGGIHLNRICIVPEYQGNGIGTMIIQEIISSNAPGQPIRLQVFPNNPALNLYRRLGFMATKRTPTHIHMVYACDAE
jgi:ribosomal protein S18 acetylase RimI-like enzyme